MNNEDIKKYIWVATTIIVASVFIAAGHLFLSLLALGTSYIAWNVKAK